MNTAELLLSQNMYTGTIPSNHITQPERLEEIDPKHVKSQDLPKKSGSKSRGKEDSAILIESPTYTASEQLKSTSSSSKVQSEYQLDPLNHLTPPPELLLKKLEEKAILHDKKRELSTNAASNQINSIVQMIEVNNDMKNRKNMNDLMMYPYTTPGIASASPELLLSQLYQTGVPQLGFAGLLPAQSMSANYYLDYSNLGNLRPELNLNPAALISQLASHEDVLRSLGYNGIGDDVKGVKGKMDHEYKMNSVQDKKKIVVHDDDDTEQDARKIAQTKRKKGRQCLNKLCNTDPNDPNLWCKQKVQNSLICKECFEAWRRNQFCVFCYQIYLENDSNNAQDDKDWIECEECKRWNHIECEIENGNKALKQIHGERSFKYYCPTCKENRLQVKNSGAKRGIAARNVAVRPSYLGKTSSFQRFELTPVKKFNPKTYNHSKPADDDFSDEPIEEITKKFKLNDPISVIPDESIAKGENSNTQPLTTDIAKKKLDNMFMRQMNNTKKKFSTSRVVTFTNVETYSDIEKLMLLYGGKHFHFTETEIQLDLIKFKDLAKGIYHTDDRIREENGDGLEYADPEVPEDDRAATKPTKGRGKTRGKGGKSRGGKANNDLKVPYENDFDYESDSKGDSGEKKAKNGKKLD